MTTSFTFRRQALPCALSLALFAPALALAAEQTIAANDKAGVEDQTLKTVIVIADKIGRSVMNTPTSISVLDANDLASRAGLNTSKDILANIPNIIYTGTGNIAPTIRGIDTTGASQGGDAFIAGSRSRLNMQIDGRPASYNEIVFGDSALWDVQQVEVLRGAQSTLQGRNAIGGTIVTKTNDPTFEPEGALRLAGGNFDQLRASAMASVPLIDDTLALRLSGDWFKRTSFVDGWESFPGVDDPGDFKGVNARAKLLFVPQSIPEWKALFTWNHSDYTGPQTENVDRPFGNRNTSYLHEPVFQPKTNSAIIDTSYVLNDTFTLEGLATGTDLDIRRKAPVGDGIALIEGREYMIEPRLRFQDDTLGNGVVGIHTFRTHQDESLDIIGGLSFRDRMDTVALFGETTLPLNEVFDLIVGARYEEETHERSGGNPDRSVLVDLDETYRAFLPKLGISWHLDPQTTVGALISRGYNGGGAGAAYDEITFQTTNYQYDPEYVWTYELFGRSEVADGRVQLTANIFYSDYKDMQLTYDLTPADTSDYSYVVTNADKVKTVGAEFGSTWLVNPGWELYANVGVLKTKISSYSGSGYQGNDLPNSPSVSFSGGVSWNSESWDANLGTRYADSYYSDISNQPRSEVDPYWVANAQLGYTIDKVRLYGQVQNLFDSDKPIALYPGATREEDGANMLAPRTYTVGVEAKF
jgi:iron complex outermembrane recepter protein